MKFTAEQVSKIDRYGELSEQVKRFKPTKDEHEVLGKEIQSWYDLLPAEQAFSASGNKFDVQIGARSKVRMVFDLAKCCKALGLAKFLKVVRVSLEALDRELPGVPKHDEFLSEGLSGSRRLVAIRKAIPMVSPERFPARKKAA